MKRIIIIILKGLMVIFALIGLLSLFMPFDFIHNQKSYFITYTRADYRGLETALNLFYQDEGRFPTNEEGLQVLLGTSSNLKEKVERKFKSYIDEIPTSYEGNKYKYRLLIEDGVERPFLFSSNEGGIVEGYWVKKSN